MKHAISIIAIACLSACATPTQQPPSQPAPTAIIEPAEKEITDEQLAKQLYWYREENNQKEEEENLLAQINKSIELWQRTAETSNKFTDELSSKITEIVRNSSDTNLHKTFQAMAHEDKTTELERKIINNKLTKADAAYMLTARIMMLELKRRGHIDRKIPSMELLKEAMNESVTDEQ